MLLLGATEGGLFLPYRIFNMKESIFDDIRKAESEAEQIIASAEAKKNDIIADANFAASKLISSSQKDAEQQAERIISESRKNAEREKRVLLEKAEGQIKELEKKASKQRQKAVDAISASLEGELDDA